MAKRVLSIDISRTLIKICEVDFKSKNSKVYNTFTIKTPEGAFEDGFIAETEEFGKYLREKIEEKGIKTKQVVYTINSSRIANREALIPYVKDKLIKSVVDANASEYFPVDIKGYQVAYNIVDTVEEGDKKQYKLLVMAAPKPMLESYFELSKVAGLTVVALDYSGNSIVPVVENALTDETTMVIKVDEHGTLLTIFRDKVVVLQRSLNFGAEVAVETMRELPAFGKDLSYDEALEMLRGKTCIRKTFDETAVDDEADEGDEKLFEAKVELTDSLRGLVSGIVRVIDYYNSRNSENTISRYLLTGFGGDFSGLSKLLSHETDEKVKVLAHIDGITLDKAINSERTSFGEYIACIGAAIDPVDFIPDEHKQKKKEGGNILTADLSDLDMGQIAAIICIVGVIASAVLAGYSMYSYHQVKVENQRLEDRIDDLMPILTLYNDYTNATTLYEDVVKMYDQTQNSNENIVAFLTELQMKMPSSISIESIQADKSSVVINALVDSEAGVGKTIESLRSFESIKDILFTSADMDTNDMGEIIWRFTVTAYYTDLPSIGADNESEIEAEEVAE